MTRGELREKVQEIIENRCWDGCCDDAGKIIALVRQSLRDEVWEEAAKVVENHLYLLNIGTPEEGPFTRDDRVSQETREQAVAALRVRKGT